LLIFDEVVTGLRVSLGGGQEYYKITPDITILGKALAGGFPVGAFGGKREIMDLLSPLGEVYTAGTFSGNPMVTHCGITTLEELSDKKTYDSLIGMSKMLAASLEEILNRNKKSARVNSIGSIFSIFFTDQSVIENYNHVKKCDFDEFARYFHFLLDRGVYLSPSGEDSSFLSTAHTPSDIRNTLKVIKEFSLTQ
jgi:glutamate-1-semialdehyde 2,1-aminomutase